MARIDHAIPLIQAIYGFGGDRRAWLEDVLAKAQPLLDTGTGVVLNDYVIDADHDLDLRHFLQHETKRDISWAIPAMRRVMPRQNMEPLHTAGFMLRMLADFEGPPSQLFALRAVVRLTGHRDVLGIGVSGAPRRGVILIAPCKDETHLTPAAFDLWRSISAHLRCALRLYDRFDQHPEEAVLEPGTGKVLHAEDAAKAPDVRERLQQRAQAIDHAQSRKGRADPEKAVEIWRGLVDGTWSLVDRFDGDGRHYVVARRNEPDALDPRRLGARQWQVAALCATGAANKHIAYELGISESTVATHLSRAMRKLGCSSRTELAAVIKQAWLEPASSAAPSPP